MEEEEAAAAAVNHRSTIDTSRPFRSVKEAVAIFGERFLVGEIYTPRPAFEFPKKETPLFSPSPNIDRDDQNSNYESPIASPRIPNEMMSLSETVRKLELELENTKSELNLLKERESETEVAVASLNVELHRNMSKLARAEAAVAAKAVASSRSASINRGGDAVGDEIREEEKKRDAYLRGPSPRLAQILSINGENEGLLFVGRKKKKERKKMKPIIPLVGDLFSRKKGTSSSSLHNPLYASSPHHLQLN